jgi:enamine deaminase RidA (YjgF/YER057c/UK114 family)
MQQHFENHALPLARYISHQRIGDFIFFSGVIAVDPIHKKIIQSFDDLPEDVALKLGKTGEFSVDIRQEKILSQSWYVLDFIEQRMLALGGSMQDVFKLVQYFKNLDHFPLYSKVRNQFYPTTTPVSTVVEVSAMLPTDEIIIEVEATAYLPQLTQEH